MDPAPGNTVAWTRNFRVHITSPSYSLANNDDEMQTLCTYFLFPPKNNDKKRWKWASVVRGCERRIMNQRQFLGYLGLADHLKQALHLTRKYIRRFSTDQFANYREHIRSRLQPTPNRKYIGLSHIFIFLIYYMYFYLYSQWNVFSAWTAFA